MVLADIQERYGIDLDYTPRCWHWWRSRVEQLFTLPPEIHLVGPGRVWTRPVTRIGSHLYGSTSIT